MRVLVIDDEAPIRLLCRVNLEDEGIEVLEAPNGPTGLELARTALPDVVVMDVMMPGLDGWQVAAGLLDDAATRDIPIVFLTARAELRDRAGSLGLGRVEVVTKPFDPMELVAVVRALAVRGSERAEGGDGGADTAARRRQLDELRTLVEGT